MALRLLLLFMLIALGACGKQSADEVRTSAIESADFFLTNGRCQDAIDVLETAGRDSSNARYVKKLASAYACRAGFETARFFDEDLTLISTAPSELGGLARFRVSKMMDASDNQSYLDMQTAVNLLLYAGGLSTSASPSSAARRLALGNEAGKEVDAFLMYLLLNHFGQYLYHYGNTSTSGQKGVRDGSGNKCLASYDNLNFDNALGGVNTLYDYLDVEASDSCNSGTATDGHPDLGPQGGLDTALLCEGAVLMNNFLEVFPIVLAEFAGADFNDLSGVDTVVSTAKGLLAVAEPATTNVIAVKSQALCEAQNSATTDNLQFYFAVLIEGIFL